MQVSVVANGSKSPQLLLQIISFGGMNADISTFCKSCLHCLEEVVLRPLGHGIHAEKPTRVFRFDFCFISKGRLAFVYILIVEDDLSSNVWLVLCHTADADATVYAVIKWFSTFGTVPEWVSDRGPYFNGDPIILPWLTVHGPTVPSKLCAGKFCCACEHYFQNSNSRSICGQRSRLLFNPR